MDPPRIQLHGACGDDLTLNSLEETDFLTCMSPSSLFYSLYCVIQYSNLRNDGQKLQLQTYTLTLEREREGKIKYVRSLFEEITQSSTQFVPMKILTLRREIRTDFLCLVNVMWPCNPVPNPIVYNIISSTSIHVCCGISLYSQYSFDVRKL